VLGIEFDRLKRSSSDRSVSEQWGRIVTSYIIFKNITESLLEWQRYSPDGGDVARTDLLIGVAPAPSSVGNRARIAIEVRCEMEAHALPDGIDRSTLRWKLRDIRVYLMLIDPGWRLSRVEI
jgi:hypothetical protein